MAEKPTKAHRAAGRFFMGIGRVKAAVENRWKDEWTAPLFSLPLILDAEGTLAQDARHLVTDDQSGDNTHDA